MGGRVELVKGHHRTRRWRSAVDCGADNQRFMAERMAARIRPIESDHTPIITAPDPVVSTILEAIQTSSH
jgi:hypothetical protein